MSSAILKRFPLLISSTKFDIKGHRGLKSNLPIKWIRPEKIPHHKAEKSGDLSPLVTIDLSLKPLEFRDSEELKTADENVQKLFSLKYFPYKKTVEVIRATYLDSVKRHDLDSKSPEARVAKMTADIRDMQKHMELHPKCIGTKVRLKETIDKRRKLLKFLRTWDYKCYEWVLEKLDLCYKPVPPPHVYKRVERKRSLRMLTDKYCENIVRQRLDDYRKTLESQQEEFLVEKIKNLKWIIKEEKDCGLPPSVTDSDIQVALEKLEKVRSSRNEEEKHG